MRFAPGSTSAPSPSIEIIKLLCSIAASSGSSASGWVIKAVVETTAD